MSASLPARYFSSMIAFWYASLPAEITGQEAATAPPTYNNEFIVLLRKNPESLKVLKAQIKTIFLRMEIFMFSCL